MQDLIIRNQTITNKAMAESICHTLSKPGKMPGHGYSIPASKCKTGSKLAKIPGTPCYNCYGMKGRYRFKNVQTALMKRYLSLDHPQWVSAMTYLIAKTKDTHFRWHDVGDIQDLNHLDNICQVARNLPDVQFWLPTEERILVKQYQQSSIIPDNLTIRISSGKIDVCLTNTNYNTSSVVTTPLNAAGHLCPAPKQGNQCGTCRACWDKEVANVSYLEH